MFGITTNSYAFFTLENNQNTEFELTNDNPLNDAELQVNGNENKEGNNNDDSTTSEPTLLKLNNNVKEIDTTNNNEKINLKSQNNEQINKQANDVVKDFKTVEPLKAGVKLKVNPTQETITTKEKEKKETTTKKQTKTEINFTATFNTKKVSEELNKIAEQNKESRKNAHKKIKITKA